jgi:hypothetical protein
MAMAVLPASYKESFAFLKRAKYRVCHESHLRRQHENSEGSEAHPRDFRRLLPF